MSESTAEPDGTAVGNRMNALDPLVMLAAGMHSQPGVYALLLGSGVSTGAGIPTGWGVVTELVRRAAAAGARGDPAAADRAAEKPEAWWAEHGDGQPLGYSNLLAALGPTQAARRDLLAGFFEPTDDDAEQGRKVPGPAHRAIAQLVKRGLVKVILTTNFDRLIERALEEAGVPPQVVARPEAVAGMTPLQHARATVVKLHGDYADLQSRNTIDELSEYPAEWMTLLARVFDEYGLVISGWSADWDVALVRALEEVSSRRYPLYWDARSSKRDAATRLLAQHRGQVLSAASADDLFAGMVTRAEALDRLAEPPLTTAMAVTRLKRYLPDPVRRIDLHDLVMDYADRVVERAVAQPDFSKDFDRTPIEGAEVARVAQEVLAERRADTEPLLQLLATGITYDRDDEHAALWVDVLQRLLRSRVRTPFQGWAVEQFDKARQYPGLLTLWAAGLVALSSGRDGLLLRLLTEPTIRNPYDADARLPAVAALHNSTVFDPGVVRLLPRWNGQRPFFPGSRLLRQDLREPLRVWIPDDDEYARTCDAYEYRVALVLHTTPNLPGLYQPAAGEFIGEMRWIGGQLQAERDFLAALNRADEDWPWWSVLGERDGYQQVLDNLRERLVELQRTRS